MAQVGAYEAKTNFSKLLARARRGETTTITHRGEPIARLVPAVDEPDAAASLASLAAFERLRAMAKARTGPPITREEIKEWINEGRDVG